MTASPPKQVANDKNEESKHQSACYMLLNNYKSSGLNMNERERRDERKRRKTEEAYHF